MALTYGFFDAMLSEGVYDRLYNASNMVEYCAKIVGSGVCVADSEDSFKVTYASGVATVAPGFLFIQGYWLKNDAAATITIPGSGEYIVYAQLDTTARVMRLATAVSSASPPDALILARIATATDTVTDLRADTAVCGILDTAGSLSDRVSSVQQYIENSITGVLNQLSDDVATEVTELTALQAEAQGVIDDMEIPVGELKFSLAAQDSTWLLCDGRFIARTNYPSLCQLLGGHSIASRTSELYSQNIGNYISNMCIYAGKAWFVDYSDLRLVSIVLTPVTGESIGDVTRYGLSGVMTGFSDLGNGNFYAPSVNYPLCLSICDGRFYLTQGLKVATSAYNTPALSMWRFENGAIVGYPNTPTRVLPRTSEVGDFGHSYPYVSELTIENVPYFIYISGLKILSTGYQPEYIRCSRIPSTSGLDYDTSHTGNSDVFESGLLNGVTRAGYNYDYISNCTFHAKNNGACVYVGGGYNTDDGTINNKLRVSVKSYPDTISTVAAVSQNAAPELASRGSIIPVANSYVCLFEVNVRSNGFRFIAYKKSDNKPTVVEITMTVPNGANVWPESVVYAEGSFFVFVGTGLFVTDDPTDASTYNYADLTVLSGYERIARFGCITYDSDNQQLLILGVGSEGNTKVYAISLNRWLVSDNGAYLPKVSRNGVPAYIKAVAST